MKFYLSSFRFGNEVETLKKMMPKNNKIGHINNARDFVGRNDAIAKERQDEEIEQLNSFGFKAEALDLKDYFGNSNALEKKLAELGGVWVSGGNTFVLKQAMKLSGFDKLFNNLMHRQDFLYGGYSAGICVLSSSLEPIKHVDDPNNFPYEEIKRVSFEGLGVFNYAFLPHYKSDHYESEAISKEVERCIENKWLFKALRDGEVVILND
jgi:dipeptidase E